MFPSPRGCLEGYSVRPVRRRTFCANYVTRGNFVGTSPAGRGRSATFASVSHLPKTQHQSMNKKLIALLLSACTAGAVETYAQAPAPATVAAPAPAPLPQLDRHRDAGLCLHLHVPRRPPERAVVPAGRRGRRGQRGDRRVEQLPVQPLDDKVARPIRPRDRSVRHVHRPGDVRTVDRARLHRGTPTRRPRPNQGFYRQTFEPNLALNYTVDGVKLQPKFYDDVVLRTQTYEFNLTYTVPLKSVGSELDFTGTDGTYYGTNAVNVPNGTQHFKTWGDYWLAGVSAALPVGEGLEAGRGLGLHQGQPLGRQAGLARQDPEHGRRRPRGPEPELRLDVLIEPALGSTLKPASDWTRAFFWLNSFSILPPTS